MAVNYSILASVELDAKDIQKKLDALSKGLKIDIDINGEKPRKAAKAMDDLNKSTAETLLTYQAAHEIFSKSVEIIGNMVEQVYKLDAAMIEFQKVSDLQGPALDKYIDKLGNMGGAVARTTSTMLEGTTEFRKNGFNDEDSAQLAQVAATFQNVADEAVSAGDAASFLISQMIAFDIPAEKAETIADMVNSVSNSFSVSSADISRALNVVSASSSAMGNSLSETIALLTSATEITRNSSKAARGNSI